MPKVIHFEINADKPLRAKSFMKMCLIGKSKNGKAL